MHNDVALAGRWTGWKLDGKQLAVPTGTRISPERMKGILWLGHRGTHRQCQDAAGGSTTGQQHKHSYPGHPPRRLACRAPRHPHRVKVSPQGLRPLHPGGDLLQVLGTMTSRITMSSYCLAPRWNASAWHHCPNRPTSPPQAADRLAAVHRAHGAATSSLSLATCFTWTSGDPGASGGPDIG